ncbi:MAG: hypothetical protein ACRCZD_12770 [Phycicoccus sp.]
MNLLADTLALMQDVAHDILAQDSLTDRLVVVAAVLVVAGFAAAFGAAGVEQS